jgi:hypothetical protein
MCKTDSPESPHFEVGQSVCSTIGEFATDTRYFSVAIQMSPSTLPRVKYNRRLSRESVG